ncbi:invasin domain 3-containing protein [Leucobacter sp. HNU]|uniref:invasin domain 3-containing protein n=1 Tax=Leucobacter sp. HNU TaxID=3236805 RepID=UPI003A802B79
MAWTPEPRRTHPARKTLGVLAAATLIGAALVGGPSAPGALAAPGSPGTPAAPTPVFLEDFTGNGSNADPQDITGFVGASGMTYVADPQWTPAEGRCNGWVANSTSVAPIATDPGCSGGSWVNTQTGGTAIGEFLGQGAAAAATNFVLNAQTQGGSNISGGVVLQTAKPVAAPRIGDHFYALSAVVSATGCASGGASLGLSLIEGFSGTGPAPGTGSGTVTSVSSGHNPCTAPSQTIGTARVSTMTSAAFRVAASAPIGFRFSNANGNITGNDTNFDNIGIVDVTPQLDAAFVPATVAAGATTNLTYTVTNTSELGAKSGWSFTDGLPAGLVVAGTATTTCTAATVTAANGGTAISAGGTIASGAASCTVTIPVRATATAPASYTLPATSAALGLLAPSAATVQVVAAAADAGKATISAAPASITANGSSTSTVTVKLFDAFGNPLTAGGDTVAMSTSSGTLSSVTDRGDGTYTAVLTSPTAAGTGTVSFTVNGAAATAKATVAFTAGTASATTSTIAAAPSSITADGSSTSTVTVTLNDANGNPLTAGGAAVTMATTAGTLSAVTDNGDGTYTATLTSPKSVGSATVSFAVGGTTGTSTATVTFIIGAPDADASQIAAAPVSIVADGTTTSTVTVTLHDANGNPFTSGGSTVTMSTTAGSLSNVTDNGDGTYSATLTSSTASGTATVSFSVDGTQSSRTADVEFTAGAVSADDSQITVGDSTLTADGTSTTAVTVTLVDAHGNPLQSGGSTVTMSTTAGSLSNVTDNGDGTYTAILTAPTASGTATISFSVDGTEGSSTAEVRFTAGAVDADGSTIAVSPAKIPADGTSTSTVTVTLVDAHGNPVTGGAHAVTLRTTAGTLSDVVDNGDGTYTATLTSSKASGTATISFAVDGTESSSSAQVEFTPVAVTTPHPKPTPASPAPNGGLPTTGGAPLMAGAAAAILALLAGGAALAAVQVRRRRAAVSDRTE